MLSKGCDFLETYKEQRETTMRYILQYVHEHRSLPQDAYEWDMADIVKECVDEKFLENVKTVSTLDGHIRITAARPYVSRVGLAFLANSLSPPHEEISFNSYGIEAELKKQTQQLADQYAKQDAQKRADDAQRRIEAAENKKKDFRHDFAVAAFSVVLTLALTHIRDIINFFLEFFDRFF